MSDREKRLERATKVPSGGRSRVTINVGSQRHEVRTSASAIEIAERIKRSATRRRAEQKMRERGL